MDLNQPPPREQMDLPSRLSASNESFRTVAHRPLIIQKVPQSVRGGLEKEKRYFVPDLVSIGPYHHRVADEQHLLEMEQVKEAVAYEFCNSAQPEPEGDQHQAAAEPAVGRFLGKVRPLVGEARQCYADSFDGVFNDSEFANMMVVDGCFLLAVMAVLTEDYPHEHWSWTHGRMLRIMKDILLFENQIPWFVLRALMALRPVKVEDFVAKILAYFDLDVHNRLPPPSTPRQRPEHRNREPPPSSTPRQSPGHRSREPHSSTPRQSPGHRNREPSPSSTPRQSPELRNRELPSSTPRQSPGHRSREPSSSTPRQSPEHRNRDPVHLLDLVHRRHLGGLAPEAAGGGGRYCDYARPFAPFTSAVELAEAGIHLQGSGTCRVTDVRVEPALPAAAMVRLGIGRLVLPRLALSWLPRCWLINMVALECVTDRSDNSGVSSYLAILGSLVRAERDVEELRSRRILFSTMSDRQTVEFFEGILDPLPRQELYLRTLEGIVQLRARRSTRSGIHAFLYRNRRIIFAVAPLLSLLVAIVGIVVNNSIRHKY